MNDATRRYLELVNAEDTHKAGVGERGGKHGLVHEDGTKCDAAEIGGCPEERDASESDRALTRAAYAASRRHVGRRFTGGDKAGLGNTTHFDSTRYKRRELADAIMETGLNPNRFAMVNGMQQADVSGLLNGAKDPTVRVSDPSGGKRYAWSTAAQRVSALLDRGPEELFPDAARKVLRYRDERGGIESVRIPSRETESRDVKRKLQAILRTLTPHEEMVVKMRFGLDDGVPKTLEEVGKAFQVSAERVRQVEAKALRKLRHPERTKYLCESGFGECGADGDGYRQPAKQVGVEREATVDSAASVKDVVKRGVSSQV